MEDDTLHGSDNDEEFSGEETFESLFSPESVRQSREREAKFKIGATHGANWLRRTVKQMADAGKSAKAISEAVGQRMEVLMDWRNEMVEMPSTANPWDWSHEQLAEFILQRKDQW